MKEQKPFSEARENLGIISICAKDRKAFNRQIFQQLEPKTIFSS